MKFRKTRLALVAFALAGCSASVEPYVKTGGSSKVSQLEQTVTVTGGQVFKTMGFVEVFEPDYHVLVSAPDGRNLAQSRRRATEAAKVAVEGFDCIRGTTVRSGSRYSEEANQWLVVVRCARGGLL